MFLKPGDLSSPSAIGRHEEYLAPLQPPSTGTMAEFRQSLPIHGHRQELLYAVQEHQVTIVVGSTGSGKSTQLPQYLLEAGWPIVGITEPRRLAVISLAERVAEERQVRLGDTVGYAIGWDKRVSPATRLKFMTDGVAVRELLHHPLLEQYSVLMVDEAHERGVNTDLLLALLKKILPRRPAFRLIICSATAQVERLREFYAAFKPAVVCVEGRQYPLQVFYAAPPPPPDLWLATAMTIEMIVREREPGDILAFLPGREEIRRVGGLLGERGIEGWLPLHAGISREEQLKLFDPSSEHARIILATNVAETAITLPHLVYIVDCGLVRERSSYRDTLGIDRLRNVPISQAAATQRAGRAGRCAPGQVYRLYTEADYLTRPQHTTAEVQQQAGSLRSAWLLLLALGVGKPRSSFWLASPSTKLLAGCLLQLQSIGAMENGKISARGQRMAEMPLEPLQASLLLAAAEMDCLSEVLPMVALWSVLGTDPLFTHSPDAQSRRSLGVEEGDLISYHNSKRYFLIW